MSGNETDASAGGASTFERVDEADEAAAPPPGPAVAPIPRPTVPLPAPAPPPAAPFPVAPSPVVPQMAPAAQIPPSQPALHQLAAAPPPKPKPKRMAPPPAAPTVGRPVGESADADESTVASEARPVAAPELPVPSTIAQRSLPARGTTKEEREQEFFRAQKEAKEAEHARNEARMMAMSPEVRLCVKRAASARATALFPYLRSPRN